MIAARLLHHGSGHDRAVSGDRPLYASRSLVRADLLSKLVQRYYMSPTINYDCSNPVTNLQRPNQYPSLCPILSQSEPLPSNIFLVPGHPRRLATA